MKIKNIGFSLAEMMVVMLILSIVLAAAMPIITHRVVAGEKQEQASSNPPGAIISFAGPNIPQGWLLCDGKSYSVSGIYADLYNAIGYTYGGGGISFRVPDLRGRTEIGLDNMGGASANIVTAATADTLGGLGGEEKHLLTTVEMPSHSHSGYTDSQGNHQHASGWGEAYNASYGVTGGTGYLGSARSDWDNYMFLTSVAGAHTHNIYTYTAGGDTSHNIMQPYMAINYIIKY